MSKHRGVDLALVPAARLAGGAFAVWLQTPEASRRSVDCGRDALYHALVMDTLAAYDSYASRRLRPGESADVYLADLRRLATLYGRVPGRALACAFIAGLPDTVRGAIRAGTRAEALQLTDILGTRAEALQLADILGTRAEEFDFRAYADFMAAYARFSIYFNLP